MSIKTLKTIRIGLAVAGVAALFVEAILAQKKEERVEELEKEINEPKPDWQDGERPTESKTRELKKAILILAAAGLTLTLAKAAVEYISDRVNKEIFKLETEERIKEMVLKIVTEELEKRL